jgi:hypothetical protein
MLRAEFQAVENEADLVRKQVEARERQITEERTAAGKRRGQDAGATGKRKEK